MNDNELEEWRERLTDQKANGLIVPQLCKKNNITKYKYYYWYKRIKSSKPKSTKVPATVLPHSIAIPSLVAWVVYQKFAMGIPLNRQESDLHRMGLILPRSNMAHWIIRCSDEWLLPLYNRIREELLGCDIIHMDETRIQVNKEEGKRASSQSWMWVMQSGMHEAIQATFFHYSCTRGASVPQKLLSEFTGYLITDAYIGYEKVDRIKRSLYWAHCRRYFVESIPLDSKGKEIPGSKSAEGRGFINLLFKLEEEMKNLSSEERKESVRRLLGASLMPFGHGFLKLHRYQRLMKS